MKKTELNAQEINAWKTLWGLCSSQMYNKKMLRLWINRTGNYRVSYGNKVLYEGSQMTHAIAAWDTA